MAALKSYSKRSDDRFSGGWLQIYPKSIRYEYSSGSDEWGYPGHNNEWHVSRLELKALLDHFGVTSTPELIKKIDADELAMVIDVTRWIANNCETRG
jgi:hypothetical protein